MASGYRVPHNFERAEHQEFGNFDEGDAFLRDFCLKCARHRDDYNKTCPINGELRSAMGDNYPFWHKALVKIHPKEYGMGLVTRVECREFKPEAKD
jgi:hypothetical protein